MLYQKQIPEPEIILLAHIWAEEFGRISDQELAAALRLHRRRSNFCPTLAEVLKAHHEIRPRPVDASATVLPEITEEDMRRNRIHANMLRISLREQDPRTKAFFSRGLSWPAKDALARVVLGDDYPPA